MPHSFQRRLAATVIATTAALAGCHAKPDHIIGIPSDDPSVFYSVESSDGNGPLSSAATSVYAHLNAGKDSDRKLVLHGLYLDVQVTWVDQNNVSLCLRDGLTSEYYNQITLNAGETYRTIHNHLKEKC